MPMFRRIPKRGFHNKFASLIFTLNVSQLDAAFNEGDEITPDALRASGFIKAQFDELKILGDGEISKKLNISAHRFSKSAREKIEAAGGTATELPPKRTPQERVAAIRQGEIS